MNAVVTDHARPERFWPPLAPEQVANYVAWLKCTPGLLSATPRFALDVAGGFYDFPTPPAPAPDQPPRPPLPDLSFDFQARADSPRVVFVLSRLNYKAFRQSLHLRPKGFRTCLVALTAIPDDLRPFAGRCFDHVVDMAHDYPSLDAVLRTLAPDIIHAHCFMWEHLAGLVALQAVPKATTVAEFEDILSVYAPRQALYRNWPQALVDVDWAMERAICHAADGLIHQFAPEVTEDLALRHGKVPPALAFQPWPTLGFGPEPGAPRRSGAERPIRLVWAGSLPTPNAHNPRSLFPARGVLDLAPRLLSQGLGLDILLDPSKAIAPGDVSWEDAFALQRRFPEFRFTSGHAPDRLADAVADAHFGMILIDWDPAHSAVRPEKMRLQIPNKLMGYIEVGLPVVVARELEAVARLVEEHGLGVVVGRDEVDGLAERLAALDYTALLGRVDAFRRTHAFEDKIDELIAFYARIAKPNAPSMLT